MAAIKNIFRGIMKKVTSATSVSPPGRNHTSTEGLVQCPNCFYWTPIGQRCWNCGMMCWSWIRLCKCISISRQCRSHQKVGIWVARLIFCSFFQL